MNQQKREEIWEKIEKGLIGIPIKKSRLKTPKNEPEPNPKKKQGY